MYRRWVKRTLDILVAIAALPVVALVIAIVAPLIYIEDHGSILYVAQRLGRNGEPFNMVKLRSMKMNAPDIRNADGSTYSSPSDGRMTNIGRFLRKTSLDELPQVFNVLIGNMSFIGPRPNMITVIYAELSDAEKKRVKVRPGITGFNQAYYRNSVNADQKYANDCYYVDNVRFILDAKIFAHTILAVLKRENINANFTAREEDWRVEEEHEVDGWKC